MSGAAREVRGKYVFIATLLLDTEGKVSASLLLRAVDDADERHSNL